MALFEARIGVMTIPNGGTNSNVLTAHLAYGDAVTITIVGPAALPETVVIQVGDQDPDVVGLANVNFSPLKDVTGTAIAPPGAGETRVYPTQLQSALCIRFVAGGAVAAARSWVWSKQVVVHGAF